MLAACMATLVGTVSKLDMKILLSTLFLATLSALFQIVQPLLGSWLEYWIRMRWTGGSVGYLIHDYFLAHYLGFTGSVVILSCLLLASVFMLFELHPLKLWQAVVAYHRRRLEEKERIAYEQGDAITKIEIEERRLKRKQEELLNHLNTKEIGTNRKGKSIKIRRADEDEEPQEEQIEFILAPRDNQFESKKNISTLSQKVSSADQKQQNEQAPEKKKLTEEELLEAIAKKNRENREKSQAATIQPKQDKSGKSEPDPFKISHSSNTPAPVVLPPLDLLKSADKDNIQHISDNELAAVMVLIITTLEEFGIECETGEITQGTTITRYEVIPGTGVRVEKISSLAKNLARAMKAESINILAPIPGKNTVGIEVPNTKKIPVTIKELLESQIWKNTKAKLPLALGKDVYGKVLVADLAEMPHLLIAGSTGSGKSVLENCMILSLLYRFSPQELKIIMIDPKVVEMQLYSSTPHLIVPPVTDARKTVKALNWACSEMDKRYNLLAKSGVRNIASYNSRPAKEPKKPADPVNGELPLLEEEEIEMPDKLPYLVIIIDELAELMFSAVRPEIETAISRLSAKARAAGIHMIIATQTPRSNVISGVIKTNVPSRIALKVSNALDSRVILDENGAENLVGKGDFLYLPPGTSSTIRGQGAFVTETEVQAVVDHLASSFPLSEPMPESGELADRVESEDDPQEQLSDKKKEIIKKSFEIMSLDDRCSVSHFQRKLAIGYNTAAWVVDWMEQNGLVGPKDGARDREILVDLKSFDIEKILEL